MREDYRDALAELLRADARFVVVGAYALGFHGVPRATVDLDILVEPTPENARRVWRALAAFGAPLTALGITEADFTRPDIVAEFGLPPWRLDVMTGVTGVTFAEAWADRVEGAFDDLMVPYLGRETLIRNKRAAGRHRDLGDVEALGS